MAKKMPALFTSIFCSIFGLALFVGPAIAQSPNQEDAIKAELEKLREQTLALQAKIQALQAAKAKADQEASEKYIRKLAESCLEAIFGGDPIAIIPLFSKEIRDQYLGNNNSQVALTNFALGLAPDWKGIEVSSYKITDMADAANHEEAIFRVQFSGKVKNGDEKGKQKQGTLALQIHKDKESGRFVIGFASMHIK